MSRSVPEILKHVAGTLSSQQTTIIVCLFVLAREITIVVPTAHNKLTNKNQFLSANVEVIEKFRHKRVSNLESAALQAGAFTTRPARW